jgi:hypothetical protein
MAMNICRNVMGRYFGKESRGRSRRRCEVNIKLVLMEMLCEDGRKI